MRLLWTDAARQDLVDIGDYIALRSPVAASRFVAELFDRTGILTSSPLAGRVVPEFGNVDIRELIHGNYRIVYRIVDETIQILTVFEGHRLFDAEIVD
ncbi:MAG: type II toxin-antitoxin system RelE/ParE family toxin [Spirochaetales bacterium]|nr:type II toxin-antitoxin system RelE/ParE family toxin [Spirochaetales bacterium]